MGELKERRNKARRQEEKVEKQIKANRRDLKELRAAISEEKDERERLKSRRKDILEELRAEHEADERGEGVRSDQWEERWEDRVDELADLIETSEARVDRLIQDALAEKALIDDLKRKDDEIEERVRRLSRKIKKRAERTRDQLSRDFHLSEFDCRDGTDVPDYMASPLRQLCLLHLQPLRDSGGVVTITSGYRTQAYNARIGGASQSYHVYDLRRRAPAADHVQQGRSPSAVQQWHEGHNPFDGMGFYSGFTHGDDRGYHSRWYGAG